MLDMRSITVLSIFLLWLGLGGGMVLAEEQSHSATPDSAINAHHDDPAAYFPTRPGMRDMGERIVRGIEDTAYISADLTQQVIGELKSELTSTEYFFSGNLDRAELYTASVEVGDCRRAEALVWDELIDRRPFFETLARDNSFRRTLQREVLELHFPELATCLYALEATTLDRFILNLSAGLSESIEQDNPAMFTRPFASHLSWMRAAGTIHGRQDINYVRLGEMATGVRGPDYGPAGVLLVELSLELDSLNLPEDMLAMLLLRAEETWPEDDAPLPVAREAIAELLNQIRSGLSDDELARAQRCFISDELGRRLFLGDHDYFAAAESEQCQLAEDL